eukprot:8333725-Ditylum_brightwellii.AAC.1
MGWWRFLAFANLSGKSESMGWRSFMQQHFQLAGSVSVDGYLDLVDVGRSNGLDGKAREAVIWCVWAFTIRNLTYSM